jgi:hypothetical protein
VSVSAVNVTNFTANSYDQGSATVLKSSASAIEKPQHYKTVKKVFIIG